MSFLNYTSRILAVALVTLTVASAQNVRINEIVTDAADWCELANFSAVAQNIGGWQVVMTGDQPQTTIFTFPVGTMIGPGEIIAVVENTATTVPPGVQRFISTNINWNTLIGGACGLNDAAGVGIDLVLFGNPTNIPVQSPPSPWSGSLPTTGTNSNHFFRRVSTIDTNSTVDWVMTPGPATPGVANPGQTSTVAPVASFTQTRSVVPGSGWVRFTSTASGNPATWSWDFDGNGTVDSVQANPGFLYTTPGSYTVSLTVVNMHGSHTLMSMAAVQVVVPTPVTAPYTQAFSTSPLGSEWELTADSAQGRQIVVAPSGAVSPISGGNVLLLDSLGGATTNRAILHVNLVASGGAILKYQVRETADEVDADDGVFLFDGVTTALMQTHGPTIAAWTQYEINIAQFVADNGMIAGPDMRVIFSQRDDNPSPTDGIFVDDVRLELPPAPDIGQENTLIAQLDVNGGLNLNGQSAFVGEPGPFFATGTSVVVTVRGQANQPYLLLIGPLNRNNAVFPFGSLDIGFGGPLLNFSDIQIVLDGAAGVGLFDSLARLDGTGFSQLGFGLPPVPMGTVIGTMQALVYNSGPSVVGLTAAFQF